jgi:hypothetical protein
LLLNSPGHRLEASSICPKGVFTGLPADVNRTLEKNLLGEIRVYPRETWPFAEDVLMPMLEWISKDKAVGHFAFLRYIFTCSPAAPFFALTTATAL